MIDQEIITALNASSDSETPEISIVNKPFKQGVAVLPPLTMESIRLSALKRPSGLSPNTCCHDCQVAGPSRLVGFLPVGHI